MKIKQAITELQRALKKVGNVRVLVDTEAGEFPCHMVDVDHFTGSAVPESGEKAYCLVTLDPEVMCTVHPVPSRAQPPVKETQTMGLKRHPNFHACQFAAEITASYFDCLRNETAKQEHPDVTRLIVEFVSEIEAKVDEAVASNTIKVE